MKRLLMVLLACVVPHLSYAAEVKLGVVSEESATVYEVPSRDGVVLFTLNRNTNMPIFAVSGDWLKVMASGNPTTGDITYGWIHASEARVLANDEKPQLTPELFQTTTPDQSD